jgi:hypothetical protein
LLQSAKAAGLLPAQAAVHALPALAESNAALLGRNEQGNQLSRGTGAGMGPVIETVSRQRFEYPYERRVFLLPPLNEKLPVTEFSAKRLCCHWKAPIDSIILHFDCSA